MLGVDAAGAPRTVSHWTDVVTTADPVVQADRTYLGCTDTMTLDGVAQPIVVTWTEGFFLGPDGSVLAEGPFYEEALVVGSLETDDLRMQRYSLPLLADERLELVRREIDRIIAERADLPQDEEATP